jgi:ADP-ribosylarginine hydrolase
MNNNIDIKDCYNSMFILHALGDTIGYNNGKWEFNNNFEMNDVLEFVYEFISFGGINRINLKNWIVSDDTLYHIAIANSLLEIDDIQKIKNLKNSDIKIIIKNLVIMYKRMLKEEKNNLYRAPGRTTTDSIKLLSKKKNINLNLSYDSMSQGNGCAMRTLCIGLVFHKEKDLEKLIEFSINSSILTHSSPIGYLAGLTAAYFISLAIRKVDIYEWAHLLIILLESKKVLKYINKYEESKDYTDIMADYTEYILKWKDYIKGRFNDKSIIDIPVFSNLQYRLKFFYDTLFIENKYNRNISFHSLSSIGYFSVIMAYDALIESQGCWEKLIFYAMLHPGDSDTIGAIAGGFYGTVYGYGDVPNKMLEHLEEKEVLLKLGDDFYSKFYE